MSATVDVTITRDFDNVLVMSAVHQLTTVFCVVGSLFIVRPSDMLTAKSGAVLKTSNIFFKYS